MSDKKRNSVVNIEPVKISIGDDVQCRDRERLLSMLSDVIMLSSREGSSYKEIGSTLSNVLEFIGSRFEYEHAAMESKQYLDYAAHRLDHEALADELFEIVHRFEKLDRMARDVSIRYIVEWFQIHAQTHDIRFHEFMANCH